MTDRVAGRPPGAAEAFSELDPEALREFNTLAEFLTGLSQQQTEQDETSVAAVLASVSEMEQSPRWMITLRGARRLARVAALRERLAQAPPCLAARVVDFTPEEIHLLLTTTARITRAQVESIMAEALVEAECPVAFDIQPQPSVGSG